MLIRGYSSTCATIVHQLLSQLLMDSLDTLSHITGTIEIFMKKFDAKKIIFDKMATLLT